MVSVTVSAKSIGIGIVIQAESFFPKLKLLFSNFAHFVLILEDTSLYNLENKPSPSKIFEKYLLFGRNFGFRGLFMMEKMPHAIGN